MEFVADLHLHSKYSRAVSQSMVLPFMAEWARKKGLNILSAPDWTHPLWFKEMKAQLTEAHEGLYKLKNERDNREVLFLFSTEIASIYSQDGKLRRIHNVIFSPSLETAERVSVELRKRGCNLSSDGRPIIGISSHNLLQLLLEIDKRIILIPAHIWTPHFGVYGSKSGFDSLKEAFGELCRFIYGIETGISSDPFMNWQVPELSDRSILSFSDAHSAPKMGRETTVFKLERPSYTNLGKAISAPMRRDQSGKNEVSHTIEFYPEEGKYHYAGHRNCGVVRSPEEINKDGNVCPVCNRVLTEGVMFRVDQLAQQNSSFAKALEDKQNDKNGVSWIRNDGGRPPFVKLVPLIEIIAEGLSSTTASDKVREIYEKLCFDLDSELNVLLKAEVSDIIKSAGPKIAEGVSKVRSGHIEIDPGFDGEYGKVKIWSEELQEDVKIEEQREQMGLF